MNIVYSMPADVSTHHVFLGIDVGIRNIGLVALAVHHEIQPDDTQEPTPEIIFAANLDCGPDAVTDVCALTYSLRNMLHAAFRIICENVAQAANLDAGVYYSLAIENQQKQREDALMTKVCGMIIAYFYSYFVNAGSFLTSDFVRGLSPSTQTSMKLQEAIGYPEGRRKTVSTTDQKKELIVDMFRWYLADRGHLDAVDNMDNMLRTRSSRTPSGFLKEDRQDHVADAFGLAFYSFYF